MSESYKIVIIFQCCQVLLRTNLKNKIQCGASINKIPVTNTWQMVTKAVMPSKIGENCVATLIHG